MRSLRRWRPRDATLRKSFIAEALAGDANLSTSEWWRKTWALDGEMTLVWSEAEARLQARLRFELCRKPTPTRLAKLLKTIENDVPSSGWGMNIEWETDDVPNFEGLHVGVDWKVERHELRLEGL